ncbi:hypothetical protein OS493_022996 [Desmophyllum pertusum]|uniref:Major facilitator superfamily (MFS) profile domain-containing protein n=1 Tax=Desmophyllum pertusum TaxID=174260 RepID=A0A9X0CWT5_9CNID|nr:hypothetical protein OS493_022996 [Desmophyllum pertusum]
MFGVVAIPMILGPPVAGWLYEASGSYHQAFFVCGGVAIISSLLVFIVSRLDRNQRRLYSFKKRSSNTSRPKRHLRM